MNFKRRFLLLLSLGIFYSLTLMTAQVDPLIGGFVATLGVVINYWVALIVLRKTVMESTEST